MAARGTSRSSSGPQLSVLGQYIKDFSFESPNAPRSLAPKDSQPAINIRINVGVGQLAPTDFEVSLKLEGKAESEGMVLFTFNLTFAGIFRIQNVPQERSGHDRVPAAVVPVRA
jgi:preprotein translocase subunit SecB